VNNVDGNDIFNFLNICNRLNEMTNKFNVLQRESSIERDIKE